MNKGMSLKVECPKHGLITVNNGEATVIQSSSGDTKHDRKYIFPQILCMQCGARCYVTELNLGDD